MALELGSALSIEREPVKDPEIRVQTLEAIYLQNLEPELLEPWLGLAADVGLAGGKALTGYLSGSTAIIADAAHSISDMAASMLLLSLSLTWKTLALYSGTLAILGTVLYVLSFSLCASSTLLFYFRRYLPPE